jgi:hypothetical protein
VTKGGIHVHLGRRTKEAGFYRLTLPPAAEVGSTAHVHLHPIAALKRQASNQRF